MISTYRVWCEWEEGNKQCKKMVGPESNFLLSQTGQLMAHGPISFDSNIRRKYTVLIPEFYTGINDRKSEKIYEGDIVKGMNSLMVGNVIGQVIWDIQSACWGIENGWSLGNYKWFEVIGNIHENSEILTLP